MTHVRNSIQVVDSSNAKLPQEFLERVQKKLIRSDYTKVRWTTRELGALLDFANEKEFVPKILWLLYHHRSRVRFRVLATALCYFPSEGWLRKEAEARFNKNDYLPTSSWLASLHPSDLRSVQTMAKRLVLQTKLEMSVESFHEHQRVIPNTPLYSEVLEWWIRRSTRRSLALFAEENLVWAVNHCNNDRLARQLFDRMLAYEAGPLPAVRALERQSVQWILQELKSRYGGWADSGPSRYRWQKHHSATIQLASVARIRKNLYDFFDNLEGASDRLAYWREWIPRMSDAVVYEQVNAFAMTIDGLVFVEFGQVGNALYGYSEADWQRMAPSRSVTNVGSLKSKPVARLWLSHTKGWHSKADREIAKLVTGGRRAIRNLHWGNVMQRWDGALPEVEAPPRQKKEVKSPTSQSGVGTAPSSAPAGSSVRVDRAQSAPKREDVALRAFVDGLQKIRTRHLRDGYARMHLPKIVEPKAKREAISAYLRTEVEITRQRLKQVSTMGQLELEINGCLMVIRRWPREAGRFQSELFRLYKQHSIRLEG